LEWASLSICACSPPSQDVFKDLRGTEGKRVNEKKRMVNNIKAFLLDLEAKEFVQELVRAEAKEKHVSGKREIYGCC